MVAYSFKRRFVGQIRSGTKAQTVRAPRKLRGVKPRSLAECRTLEEQLEFIRGHVKPGQGIQLYTGMRTSHCKLIGRSICASVEPIRFDFDTQDVTIAGNPPMTDLADLDAFAQRDGFEDFRGLVEFWRENHSGVQQWEGVLIRWVDFQKETL